MLNGKSTWLLVADASKARIFSMHKALIFQQPNPANLKLIGEYSHEKSRLKGIDLETDRMGLYGSVTFEEPTSPKFHEAEQFAHELLGLLETGRVSNNYRDLILVAPPSFMGILNKHMPHEMHKVV